MSEYLKEVIQRPWPWWRWVLLGLASTALGLSAVMSWHNLMGGTMAGCSGGSPCEQVLNSHWSRIAGILPVSGLAIGVYLAIIVSNFFIGPESEYSFRRLAWSAMLILTGSVSGSAVWFIIVQKWFIGAFCPYCMTAHITGLLLSGLIIWKAMSEFKVKTSGTPSAPGPGFRSLKVMRLILIGLVIAGILAASQVSLKPATVYVEGKSGDSLQTTNYNNVPVIGSPDATYLVTLLFDYQCSHCQRIHFMLDEAVRLCNGKLAFALLPVPLDADCNPYISNNSAAFKNSCELARIGLAVWIADRKSFPVFEDWMFTFESGNAWHPRSLESSVAKAVKLVGQAKLDAALNDPRIGQILQTSTHIYGQTLQGGTGGIPKLILGSRWVIPEPNDAHDLIKILQKSLGVNIN
jgi:uncharacterized membrane protein